METITVNVLDYFEFDELVRTHFPQRSDYEFAAEEESGNDVDYLVTGVGDTPKYKEGVSAEQKEKWRQSKIDDFEKWLRRESFTGVGKYQILEALCRKGVIKPGNYLIRVSW